MKVNQMIQQNQEKIFKENLSFKEWMDYFSLNPSNRRVNKIIRNSFNNIHYQPPLLGA